MKFVFFIIGVAISCIAWWLSGFDFDARGTDALNCFFTSMLSGFLVLCIGSLAELGE